MKKKLLMLGLFMLLISPLNVSADVYDDYYNIITKEEKIYLNTIEPANMEETEGLLTYAFDQFSNDEFKVWGMCPVDESCYVEISDEDGSKQIDVEVIYNSYNLALADKVNTYKSKFGIGEEELITMYDLDVINYIYNRGDSSNFDIINSIVNYSSELKTILGNSNIKATLDTRMGWTHDFSEGVLGFLVLSYQNFAYAVVNRTGFAANKVLYIPEATANTSEAFITAAKQRLKNYLGVDIEITKGGTIAELEVEYYDPLYPDASLWGEFELDKIINLDNTLEEYYIFEIKGEEYRFFIEKNDEKMTDGALNTKDLDTGSMISANSPLIPLDSQISYKEIAKDSTEYKEILAKLKLKDGMMADIKLFSNSKDAHITKLDNGMFKVYIPVSEEMQKQTLIGYYLKDDGTIEEYAVKIENGYAIFETNHFSTYTLGVSAEAIANPQTFDNIGQYIILGTISLIGLIGCSRLLLRTKKFQ